MMVVGTVQNGISKLNEVLRDCDVNGSYGLIIKQPNEVNGIITSGRYVRELVPVSDYQVISDDDLQYWVDKYCMNLSEEDEEDCQYDLWDVMNTLKPIMSLDEYLSNEYMQIALDIFISSIQSAFEPAYIRSIDGDKLCIWFVDMSNY